MITPDQMHGLGYTPKKENINMHNGSTDYKPDDFENRSYLVNLSKDGIAHVVFPINKPQKGINTGEFDNFKKWHEGYQKP